MMTPEKQDKTLELSKHWSVDSTPARNEVIMKRTFPVKYVIETLEWHLTMFVDTFFPLLLLQFVVTLCLLLLLQWRKIVKDWIFDNFLNCLCFLQ